ADAEGEAARSAALTRAPLSALAMLAAVGEPVTVAEPCWVEPSATAPPTTASAARPSIPDRGRVCTMAGSQRRTLVFTLRCAFRVGSGHRGGRRPAAPAEGAARRLAFPTLPAYRAFLYVSVDTPRRR